MYAYVCTTHTCMYHVCVATCAQEVLLYICIHACIHTYMYIHDMCTPHVTEILKTPGLHVQLVYIFAVVETAYVLFPSQTHP